MIDRTLKSNYYYYYYYYYLPNQDLFRTKIQVNCDTVKLVTISIFYSTGTVLVQGNRCPRWRDE